MLKNIFIYLSVSLIAALTFTGCTDDLLKDYGINGEGEMEIPVDIDFMPMAAADITSRASSDNASADAMSDIEDLCIVLFKEDGSFKEIIEVNDPLDYNEYDIDRTEADAVSGQLSTEVTTKRRSLNLKLTLGEKLYIYAVANLNSPSQTTRQYLEAKGIADMDREEFCSMRRTWDPEDIKQNDEMAGYFTDGYTDGSNANTTSYGNEGLITVRTGSALHCWLRRLASRVSIGFDATNLDDNTTIYIRDVRIHDVPYDCSLLTSNAVEVQSDGKVLRDVSGGLLDDDKNKQVLEFFTGQTSTTGNSALGVALTSGRKNLDDYQRLNKIGHEADHKTLFFYENMQGEGELKHQDTGKNDTSDDLGNVLDSTPDGKVDSPASTDPNNPHYKDAKPAGTYIEVRAYYVSEARGNEGRGEIFYRFMLGKDADRDYNAERNHHYKLTLKFNGYANDYDWHIEYNQRQNDITIPNPYYISYGYNESLELPISIIGEVEKAEATILRNDWWPSVLWEDVESDQDRGDETKRMHLDRSKVYYNSDDVKQAKAYREDARTKFEKDEKYKLHPEWVASVLRDSKFDREGVANGFLSLKLPVGNVIGDGVSAATDPNKPNAVGVGVNYIYNSDWAAKSLGYRSYDVSKNVTGSAEEGTYSVKIEKAVGKKSAKTTMYLPLYTRQKNLVKTTGYTGANPYVTDQRRAQVRYKFTLKSGAVIDTIIDIVQVAKIENPMGVWRDWNNAAPFDVVLKVRYGDTPDFRNLRSRGGWSAEVESGNDWILLNGGRKKIYGGDDTNIAFTYRPAGTLSDPSKVRCGVILVKYHNYSCVHRIFVRQGYAPIQIQDDHKVEWFSFNMKSKGVPADSPLDEGSLFRYGNWDQAIASSNNVADSWPEPWLLVNHLSFSDHSDQSFVLAAPDKDGNTELKWGKIKSKTDKMNTFSTSRIDYIWSDNDTGTFTFDGRECRLMNYNDIDKLREGDHSTIRNAYGILYGDGATTTQTDVVTSYRYDSDHRDYGMRGCFAYNSHDGRQIFFPIGQAGYGHRKAKRNTTASTDAAIGNEYGYGVREIGTAVLRYAAGRITFMKHTNHYDEACFQPLFYDLFRRHGAIYWANNPHNAGTKEKPDFRTSLDINYFTFDFNNLGTEPFQGVDTSNGKFDYGSDACFIRLVAVPPGTSKKPKR
ncbi:MAG: hypothetical protein NC098_01180 [Lachnoclostridium sp.]|nr:hypothetical protein [Lachnoclostridium sp.]